MGGIFELLLLCSSDPPLTDCERFPPRPVAVAALEFNRSFHHFVELRQGVDQHNWWHWQDVLSDTDYLYNCWESLAIARGSEGEDNETRRHALQRLQELLGDEAYYQGSMPPAVPVWYFLVND